MAETTSYDNLIVEGFPIQTERLLIELGQNLTRGALIGIVTASGEGKQADTANVDGSEVAYGILVEDVDASAAAAYGDVYVSGAFNEASIGFGGADTIADHKANLRTLGIFTKKAQTA